MKILLVEDNERVAGFLVKGLREEGHTVDHAENGRDGLFLASSETYDTIIMDRILPGGIEGLAIVEALRKTGNKTPILILSALGEVDDRIRGLRAGGDDYLAKPFAFGELVARLDALVRRARDVEPETDLAVGDLRMDPLSHRVTRAGRPIQLAAQGVPAAGVPDAARGAGGDPYDAVGERLGLPFRSSNKCDRLACQQVAAENRLGIRRTPLLHTVRGAGYKLATNAVISRARRPFAWRLVTPSCSSFRRCC
jgi:CheY-like chemotaxis protein